MRACQLALFYYNFKPEPCGHWHYIKPAQLAVKVRYRFYTPAPYPNNLTISFIYWAAVYANSPAELPDKPLFKLAPLRIAALETLKITSTRGIASIPKFK